MSNHVGFVVKVNKLRKHSNADRLQIATFFNEDVIVGLDVQLGDVGVYFPEGLQLSETFVEKNNLARAKDENGNNVGGYLDSNKRNVVALKLRGEKSYGIFVPLRCFDYCFDYDKAENHLSIGDTISELNGHEICKKYIPRTKPKNHNKTKEGNRTRKYKDPVAPLFAEHADTEQLAYNLDAFKEDDLVEITLKMHGTSGRTAYLPVLKGYKRSLWDRITRKSGKPIYDWGYVSGTRRTVLEDYEGGYYGSNSFREKHAKTFEGKLEKGESVYYEITGYLDDGNFIMPPADNRKLKDKEFIKTYGEVTEFTYGCEKGQSELYVYRMTMTNEDGYVVEYTPDFMRYRCEQMGVKCVPVLHKDIVSNRINWVSSPGEFILDLAENLATGPDPIGKTHLREGVVVRIVNRPKFTAFKNKSFEFKVLENIIKMDAVEADIEEQEALIEEEREV